MRSTLITIAFLLHSQAFAATSPATVEPAKRNVTSVHPTSATPTRVKFQPGQEPARLDTVKSTQVSQAAPRNLPATDEASEPDGMSYGTLLAALALMATIAIRRSRAGIP
jgi:cell division septation protein DedD